MTRVVRQTRARVDLAALARNYAAIDAFVRADPVAPTPRVMPVVKANAYGHGAARVARALEAAGAPMLAVADIEEGIAIREAGVTAPILVFGALSISDVAGVFVHRLTPTVSSPWAARTLADAARARETRLACHLKIDTGMHRLGFRHDNLARTLPPIFASPHLHIEAVYTHFATADDHEHPLFEQQRSRFASARAAMQRLGLAGATAHAANSAALLRDTRVWFDAVRPGLLLYGVVPPPVATTLVLEPVLSLRSRVVAVKQIRATESVGYGGRYVADGPRTLAVIPAGYADGLDLRLGGRGHVLIRGRRAPIVGSVCMDMLTVDVTGLDIEPGDEAVFIGSQGDERIDVREMAAAIGTIPWEVLCRIGTRIERVYV